VPRGVKSFLFPELGLQADLLAVPRYVCATTRSRQAFPVVAPSAEEERCRDPRTSAIIGAAIEVHHHLGPGLLESTYEECLGHELHLRGLVFTRQVAMPVIYKKACLLDCGHKIELSGRDEVVMELKAMEKILPSTRHSF
jgi:GxxExxY protein